MFTGLVQHLGEITAIDAGDAALRLTIQAPLSDLQLGESIAIDGVCLTVAAMSADGQFECDVSPETWQVTAASQYQVGHQVNVERALQLTDRLGGHLVLGHVDDCAALVKRQTITDYLELTFQFAHTQQQQWLIVKGSVCVNGVSLTINAVDATGFRVMIIPHTLANTNLAWLSVGETVNIEYDYLAKIVHQQVATLLPKMLDNGG